MKIIAAALILLLGSSALLQARSMENLRASAQDLRVDTAGLRKQAAADRSEIKPVPVLVQAIVNFFKLLFAPNGDIEIANPTMSLPQYEGELEDDAEEETYVEGQAYDPVDPAELPEDPFPQQPPQVVYQPQNQPAPRAEILGPGGGIPSDLKRKALEYFNTNSGRIQNKRYIGVVDFSRHSSQDRFWILDVQSGAEHAMHVAHGTGSDPDGDGYATRFSNVPNSRASSLGFYLTGDLYTGKHGKSMRLHGLSSTNSNALSRAVVLHDSNYVREGNYRAGRSFGCLAVANSEIGKALASLRGGALIYAGLSNSDF
ncbi:MAG: murein L,D-transpeptidase catalytic domain family protein [Elusimicrobiales bacterium]